MTTTAQRLIERQDHLQRSITDIDTVFVFWKEYHRLRSPPSLSRS